MCWACLCRRIIILLWASLIRRWDAAEAARTNYAKHLPLKAPTVSGANGSGPHSLQKPAVWPRCPVNAKQPDMICARVRVPVRAHVLVVCLSECVCLTDGSCCSIPVDKLGSSVPQQPNYTRPRHTRVWVCACACCANCLCVFKCEVSMTKGGLCHSVLAATCFNHRRRTKKALSKWQMSSALMLARLAVGSVCVGLIQHVESGWATRRDDGEADDSTLQGSHTASVRRIRVRPGEIYSWNRGCMKYKYSRRESRLLSPLHSQH